jgi:NitT/TauT family transport system ATP-binding protein
MSYIQISNLCKTYPSNNKKDDTSIQVFNDFNLEIDKGEFVAFFGPNACGKSTLLRILAGVECFQKGNISVDGCVIAATKVGYIFQDYEESLFPWQTVLQNIATSLKSNGLSRKERKAKVCSLLQELGLDLPLNLYPYQLSGGQQQMVAIARALIVEPDIMLMDEPLSSLDWQNSLIMRDKIQQIWEMTHTTTLFVSHDLDSAIYLADRLIILSDKPVKIKSEIKISLPRSRDLSIIKSQEFFNLKNKALEFFSSDFPLI